MIGKAGLQPRKRPEKRPKLRLLQVVFQVALQVVFQVGFRRQGLLLLGALVLGIEVRMQLRGMLG
jgi:hypothetical protein